MSEGTQIAKAYVQIIPSAKGIKNQLKSIMEPEAVNAGKSSGGIFSNAFSSAASAATGFVKTAAGITTAAVGAATTAVGALTKSAVSNFGECEQLVGGVETLFKDSANEVQKYAKEAYKNQGMNANEYMNTVTSFSASLLQSLSGDTAAAAQKADLAITDMSDNANKMGSSMESIQNAYQGFAKQNYTMLDNLKLGYGGTKEEMQRLLEDASKLSGIKYDISSYADIVDAIHVVQNEMGITGTTAKEAATTIEGSLGMVKASWTNLITGLGDKDANLKELTGQLVDSVGIAFNNILPVAEQALSGITQVISELIPVAMNEIPTLINNVLPQLLDSGKNITQSLLDGIQQNSPTIISGGMQILSMLTDTIISMLPQLIQIGAQVIETLIVGLTEYIPELVSKGADLLNNLGSGMSENMPQMIEHALTIIQNLVTTLAENAPILIDAAINFFMGLAQGLANSIPVMIEMIPQIITDLANIINDNAPTILKAGVDILITLGMGIINAIPTLIENIPKIFEAFLAVWQALDWINLGKQAITALGNGILAVKNFITNAGRNILDAIKGALKDLPGNLINLGKNAFKDLGGTISGMGSFIKTSAKKIFDVIIHAFKDLPKKLLGIGKDIITGLWNGISDKLGWLTDKLTGFCKNALGAIKSFFGIASPSKVFRDEVGKWIPEGMAVGIDANADAVYDSMEELKANTLDIGDVRGSFNYEYSSKSSDNGLQRVLELLNEYLPAIGNQQLVLDTGALVGGTVSQFDTALGKLQISKGRGR